MGLMPSSIPSNVGTIHLSKSYNMQEVQSEVPEPEPLCQTSLPSKPRSQPKRGAPRCATLDPRPFKDRSSQRSARGPTYVSRSVCSTCKTSGCKRCGKRGELLRTYGMLQTFLGRTSSS